MPIARVSRLRTALTTALALVAVLAAAPLAAPLRAQGYHRNCAPFDSLLRRCARRPRGLRRHGARAAVAAYLGTLARTRSDSWPRAEALALTSTPTMPTPSPRSAHNERRSIRNINKSFGVVGAVR
jgi:hypothetical protein